MRIDFGSLPPPMKMASPPREGSMHHDHGISQSPEKHYRSRKTDDLQNLSHLRAAFYVGRAGGVGLRQMGRTPEMGSRKRGGFRSADLDICRTKMCPIGPIFRQVIEIEGNPVLHRFGQIMKPAIGYVAQAVDRR
jgi:hypothetical protein